MDLVSLLEIGSSLLLNLGFCWLVGALLARYWMNSGGADHQIVEHRLRKFDLVAAGLTAAASVVALLAATAVMGGVGLREACPMFWTMLTATDYGRAGCIAVAAMALLFTIRLLGGAGRASDIAMLLCLTIFAVTRAFMGHAGEEGFWTLALAAEAIHFSAIAVWTGAVLVSAWFALDPTQVGLLQAHGADRYLDMMSRAAMLAVIGIVVTGSYNAWQRIGSAEHLTHTGYGLTLLFKVGLVLIAIGLGGYNKFIGLPAAARSSRGLNVVRMVLRVESVLLLATVAAAAALTTQPPPSAM